MRFLLFILLFSGSLKASESSACSFVLKRLQGKVLSSTNISEQRAIAEEIVSLLIEYSQSVVLAKPSSASSNDPQRFFTPFNSPSSQSFHSPKMNHALNFGRSSMQLYRNKGGTTYILQIPKTENDTVWSKLSPEGRRELAKALEAILRMAEYDKNSYSNFDSAAAQFTNAGISPWLVFRAANEKKKIGACVHSNCTLAGMLGELGAPNDAVRLWIGQNLPLPGAGKVHFFGQFRTHSDSAWHFFDATPLNDGTGLVPELLNAIRERNPDFDEHMRQGIEETYIFFPKSITNFLK